MAVLYKDKNLFQRLSIPVAVLTAGGYVLLWAYVYFIAEDYMFLNRYEEWIEFVCYIIFELIVLFSSAANDINGVVAHMLKFFIPSAAFCVGAKLWIDNYFTVYITVEDKYSMFWAYATAMYGSPELYAMSQFRNLVVTLIALNLFGAFVCYAKMSGSNSGWIRKHTYNKK